MSNLDDKQIIADFVIESRERLADVENQILAIETGGAESDPELVNEVFRAVHSIKGAAGFLGFTTLSQLAHHLESVLNQVRNRKLVLDAGSTDVLLRGADTLRRMLDDVQQSNELDVTDQIDLLQQIVSGLLEEGAPPATEGASSTPATVRQAPADPLPSEEPSGEAAPATPAESPPSPPGARDVRPGGGATEARSATGRAPESGAQADAHIRVSVAVLDRLMNLAGELVLARNQLLQSLSAADRGQLESVAARVNQVTSELQETIMQTRLQEVGTVFNKFPRVVRDLSNVLQKQCQLTVEGQDVELDKSIIEAISDPLTHLVRNAVDHGIEPPETRVRAGKPPAGTVSLKAFHQAGKVNISISDDGRGIDVARLREKALARGAITAEQARDMSDRDVLNLIFRPGFSTAENVTQVSGRGVGMDVVKTNIERLGGNVFVETQQGAGTTFHVKLPLTLAIVPALIVRSGDRRFAVPQASIGELVRVKAAEAADRIQWIQGAEVLRLRGSLLPLVDLGRVLGLRPSPSPAEGSQAATDRGRKVWNIIVVETGQLRYGLIVDGLHDSEEIVVKPLGRHLKDCPCLAGATILGDGGAALILDVPAVAAFCHLEVPEQDEAVRREDAAGGAGRETQTVLLFRNDPAEQFAVPMQWIARLERVRSDQIDSVGGQPVLQYRGQSLPLVNLESHIQARPRPEAAQVHVLVFRVEGRERGLVVHQVMDMLEIGTEVDTRMFREPGVMGSVIVDGKTTRLLDLFELSRAADPQGSAAPQSAAQDGGEAPRILLAEDSTFFREQLTRFLEEAGYAVVACPDGLAAWETLVDSEAAFDLVVTDLEMPNLDGLSLAQRIREHQRFAATPIVAVTSLAGEEDQQRGLEAGINEYHVKLDRERLLASIAAWLRRGEDRPAERPSEAAGLGRGA